jgi:hypothetical protein
MSAPGRDSVHDLDGDGDLDVLVRDGAGAGVLLNDHAGGLVRVGGRTPGIAITFIQVGRVDGNSSPDVVGFATGTSVIATGLNDGDGVFHPGPSSPVTLPVPAASCTLYAFDRDGDGDSDLWAACNVLAAPGPGTFDVIFDDAGGTYLPVATVPGTGYTVAFQAADFDGDGDQDVILGRRNPTTNGVLVPMTYIPNTPNGFTHSVFIGVDHQTYDVDVGDFDGNGVPDVFQTNSGATGVTDHCVAWMNLANGSLTMVVQPFSGFSTAAGDLDGDGRTDLVVDAAVRFSLGNGSFSAGLALPVAPTAPIALADVDLDGDLDIVETPGTIMLNLGGGTFGPPISTLARATILPSTPQVARSAIIDLDRDGDPDILAPGPIVLSNVRRQIAHGSWPRPGRPVSIDLYGTTGGAYLLFASNGTASFPLPPHGQVLIDPASAVLGAAGAFGTSAGTHPGAASFGGLLPNDAALVGWTSYWQALDVATGKVTNRITLTVAND